MTNEEALDIIDAKTIYYPLVSYMCKMGEIK